MSLLENCDHENSPGMNQSARKIWLTRLAQNTNEDDKTNVYRMQ